MNQAHRTASALVAIIAAGMSLAGADAPPGYYETAEGTGGDLLRSALHEIIDQHTVITYSSQSFDTADAMAMLDADPTDSSRVILFYSGRSEPSSSFPAWNREHLWPNSYGIDNQTPPYSDLHNLRPCDSNVNSSRGNKLFDNSDESDSNYRNPAHIEATGNSRDTDSWEPPDSRKGDVARAAFYMAVRYEGTAGEPDLELTDDLEGITTSGALMGNLTSLLIWHLLDPPDQIEMDRNDGIYSLYQGNRNPFIDRPEWAFEVFGNPLQLSMTASEGMVELSWPADLERVELESSIDLSLWEAVNSTPVNQGDRESVTLPRAERSFFRLVVR